MSLNKTSEAFALENVSPAVKLVAIYVADCYDGYSPECFVSIEALSRFTGLLPAVAEDLLYDLEAINFIGGVEYSDGEEALLQFRYGPPPESKKTPARTAISKGLREAVFERDGERCGYCFVESGEFHIDHIVPVSKGGGNEINNLIVACRECNISKRDHDLHEWPGRDGVNITIKYAEEIMGARIQ